MEREVKKWTQGQSHLLFSLGWCWSHHLVVWRICWTFCSPQVAGFHEAQISQLYLSSLLPRVWADCLYLDKTCAALKTTLHLKITTKQQQCIAKTQITFQPNLNFHKSTFLMLQTKHKFDHFVMWLKFAFSPSRLFTKKITTTTLFSIVISLSV